MYRALTGPSMDERDRRVRGAVQPLGPVVLAALLVVARLLVACQPTPPPPSPPPLGPDAFRFYGNTPDQNRFNGAPGGSGAGGGVPPGGAGGGGGASPTPRTLRIRIVGVDTN